ncbi:CHAT domain-containing protein [Actinosynnema sp. CA-299493]
MRAKRARRAATRRGDPTGAAARFVAAIGDDPAQWVRSAGEVLGDGTATVDDELLASVAALMRFTLQEISPRHPLRFDCVRYFAAATTTLADRDDPLHRDVEAVVRAELDNPGLDEGQRDFLRWVGGAIARERADREAAELLRTGARTLDPDTLDRAVALLRGAVLGSTSDEERWTNLEALGRALVHLYEAVGDPADLRAGIRAFERAYEIRPAAKVARRLSAAWEFAHRSTGDPEAHERAVRFGRAAGDQAGDDQAGGGDGSGHDSGDDSGHDSGDDSGHDESERLNNLSAALIARYADNGDGRALTEAIALLERALVLLHDGCSRRFSPMHNLGEALHAHYLHTGDTAALDRSVELGREVLAAVDADPLLFRPGVLTRLAARCYSRHGRSGDGQDLEEAAELAREVVRTAPATHPDTPDLLAASLGILGRHSQVTQDLEAIRAAEAAARARLRDLAPDHPGRHKLAQAVAALQFSLSYRTGDRSLARRAAQTLRTSGADHRTDVRTRIAMLHGAAKASQYGEDWEGAVRAHAEAIELFPLLASRGLVRTDQERRLAGLGDLVGSAASAAVQAGDPTRAATLLDHGRGILFSQVLENRDDFTDLADRHPALAEELRSVRDVLATWTSESTEDADRHHGLALRWTRLVERARALPGFARFLKPAEDLTPAAADGPVVLFALGDERVDAVIVRADGVRAVPLPGVTRAELADRARDFLAAVDTDLAVDDTADRILAWLWDVVAEPVLEALGHHGPPGPGEPWPRVWWCPSGALTFLPLHAAGHHTPGDPRAVIDRVMSSYTTTARALRYARRERVAPTGDDRTLLVTPADAAGFAPLPGVHAEREIVVRHLSAPPDELVGQDALRDRVLEGLGRHSRTHFACHGVTDPDSPSRNRLVLADHDETPLTVTDIIRLRLDADLAFLSACSTARTTPTLADESIHLASAFQLAGYRHVVASSWPVHDRFAIRFTKDFYAAIGDTGTDLAALAVHRASRRLRDRVPAHARVWAAYIHVGP